MENSAAAKKAQSATASENLCQALEPKWHLSQNGYGVPEDTRGALGIPIDAWRSPGMPRDPKRSLVPEDAQESLVIHGDGALQKTRRDSILGMHLS